MSPESARANRDIFVEMRSARYLGEAGSFRETVILWAMDFELVGPIRDVEPIAFGRTIRELARLRRRYGRGRWRKLKGIARVRLIDGTIHTAELHWYEAHGIGRKELKIKFPLLD